MGGRWRIAALVGAVAFVLGSLAPVSAEISVSPLDEYGEAAAEGEVPYRDYSLEYPPGALVPIVVPALARGTYSQAFRAFEVLLGVLLVLSTAYLLRDARRSEIIVGVGLVALLPVLLGQVVLHRYDLWPALLVSVSLVSLGGGRGRLAGLLLGLAAAAKAYAGALVVPFGAVVDRDKGQQSAWTAGAVALAAALVVTVPFALIAPGGVASSIQRQVDRP